MRTSDLRGAIYAVYEFSRRFLLQNQELQNSLSESESQLPDAVVEISQPSGDGTVWGRCGTNAGGRFEFVTEKPVAAAGEAPSLDVMVFARGLLKHLVTRLYFPDEAEANATDPVLAALDEQVDQMRHSTKHRNHVEGLVRDKRELRAVG